ncbi:23S rRNA (adenine(2503)-C(2))-methyltransferase RlmN [Parasphaerochaeta coccoides]|uniref:Radical SAM enzyme, Cfr family n=1 Tax=Parasphaerochaeta coccoides (strain ATCC BAA-1237 / DSM 17374 / SPN1) TaxID=760011 RepID=F4GKC7_PARC1|nr:23S rRNA (adenine(2503)-C(2))-methyltransferase RlmN [Parasphaerochaeta coccoides]AEC02323.1 radical SAM enzyme, Cfr family [Parasphaerochaeta coccoides DSM 17374]
MMLKNSDVPSQPSLYGLSVQDIQTVLSLDKPFRARQIRSWLARGTTSFTGMSNLSLLERTRLTEKYPHILTSEVIEEKTDRTGATKLGIRLYDGLVVECVLLVDQDGRKTACLSCQVGCAMGCVFCRTGTMGLARNLHAYEIVEQFVHLMKYGTPSHIVYMGMGEPLANTKEVFSSVLTLNSPDWFDIGIRRITISTCGIVPGILQLAESGLGVKLAISLVAADDQLRTRLMPVNRSFPLIRLKETLVTYQKKEKKRITFEYCMLGGVNTDETAARNLAHFMKGLEAIVNLIPWNPAPDLPWQTPSNREMDSFVSTLQRLGVPCTRRFSRGRGVDGACGQLAVPQNMRTLPPEDTQGTI